MRVHIESNFLECSLVHTHSLFSVLLILPTMLIPLGELTSLKAPKFVLLEPLISGLKLFFLVKFLTRVWATSLACYMSRETKENYLISQSNR